MPLGSRRSARRTHFWPHEVYEMSGSNCVPPNSHEFGYKPIVAARSRDVSSMNHHSCGFGTTVACRSRSCYQLMISIPMASISCFTAESEKTLLSSSRRKWLPVMPCNLTSSAQCTTSTQPSWRSSSTDVAHAGDESRCADHRECSPRPNSSFRKLAECALRRGAVAVANVVPH